MIASRAHNLSAAISATFDCGAQPLAILVECIADVMGAEYKPAEAPEKQKLPEEIPATYTGKYYSGGASLEISFKDDCLNAAGAEGPMVQDAPWVGDGFWFMGTKYKFITDDRGIKYLYSGSSEGCNVVAEIPVKKYELSAGWLAREGKYYLPTDMHEADLIVSGFGGVVQIRNDKDAGLVGFNLHGTLAPDFTLTAAPTGDDTTDYYLTAPITGSRDTHAPYAYKKDGVEYLQFLGFVLIEEDAAPTLKPGCFDIPAGSCISYKLPEGKTLCLDYEGARVVYHNKTTNAIVDSLEDNKPKRVSDGWIIVLSRNGGKLKVTTLEEENAICGPNLEYAEKAYKMLDEARGQGTAVSFALIKDGKLVAAAAAGTQDGDPAHPATIDDLYNIGSCSKIYCTMAIMQLVEKGLVDLDTPIVKYLPEFTMRDERYKKITLRHCLNHSNGFPGTGYYMGFMQKFDSNEVFKKHFLDYLSKSVLKAEPGEYSVYANDGFIMAQIIVEKITGMNYTEYVQKYLLQPIGCNTACSGYNNPGNRKLVNMKGRKDETIMVVGTGGISTDMRECARFAWECVEPGKIFSAESLAETAKRARTTHEVPEALTTYGLGWDNVALKGYGGLDLGEGCLSKGGGTLQFGSHFFCSKKLGIACAMSATGDCGINTTKMLCKLICELIGQEFKEEEMPEVKPLPEDFEKEYAGTYYSSTGAQEFRVEDGKVNVYVRMSLEGDPIKAAEDLKWVGEGFWMDGNIVKFITDDRGCKYMVRCMNDLGECGFGEKITKPLPKINDAWLARDGKKFFNCDANCYDLILGGLYGTAQVNCDRETNVVGFIFRGSLIPFARTPMACLDDTHTVNFLNCPGMGSRDTFAPFVWTVDGVEHLYCYGYEFVAEDGLDLLGAGTVKLGKDVCKAYKIPEGKSYKLSCEGVRVVVYDKDLNFKHDSLEAGPVESVGEGYIVVCSGESGVLKVTDYHKEGENDNQG
jgi:CubicO group peptidase (beta-lactamase class C family)